MSWRVALVDGALPLGIAEELRLLGCKVWIVPQVEQEGFSRLIGEMPPDFLVLPTGPELPGMLSATMALPDRPRVLVPSHNLAELGLLVRAVDLVMPPDVDRSVWILAFALLERATAPASVADGAEGMLPIVDLAHRGFGALGGASNDAVRSQVRDRLIQPYRSLLLAFVERRERSMPAFGGSSSRVGMLSARLAERLGLPAQEVRDLEVAGSLRDVAIHLLMTPEALASPDPFEAVQRRTVQLHPSASAALAEPGERGGIVAQAIRDHHERLDGSGYPGGKTGREISLPARILASVDVFEALVNRRPYRRGVEAAGAIGVIGEEARRRRLDTDIVAALQGALVSDEAS